MTTLSGTNRRSRLKFLFLCGLVSGLSGLAGCGNAQPFLTPERLDRGLVLVMTGIEGRSRINEGIVWGLADGRVQGAIELVDWTIPGAYLHNLRDETRNRDKAEQIAARIVRYRTAYPGRPVTLVGQSGGGAMAVWTAEAMPPKTRVDGIVLLAASLSPGYLLDASLHKSRRGIVNFFSGRDWVFLGIGTTIYGTMDGKHTSSAGRVGFDVPSGPGLAMGGYRRLFQLAWSKRMERAGYSGGHSTSGSRGFVCRYVAPLVNAPAWDDSLMQKVISAQSAATQESGR